MDKLVSTNQSAFIHGGCIHDNFLMVNQTFKMLHKKGIPSLFLKLDTKKVFDSVCWAFLLEVLHHLGFVQTWCNLIFNLLKTSSTQILVNGEPSQTIRNKRRLRQGILYLLSCLYWLWMSLIAFFIKAVERGLVHPLAGRSINQRVSIYADDVAVFVKLDIGDLDVVKSTCTKSFSYPIRCHADTVELAVQS
jgi:hypothetical protein